MRVLARAFCRLKTTLPWVPADTKLSKLDTLRLAASYIAHLRAILTDEPAPPSAQHPLNLTWPFSFQQQTASAPAAPAPAQPQPAPALPPPAGGGAELQCAAAAGWPPAACRPHLPPSPSSSCSADGDGDGDADLDEDDCPLFHRQHQLHCFIHEDLQMPPTGKDRLWADKDIVVGVQLAHREQSSGPERLPADVPSPVC
ncbi:mesoderm posterior protein 2-like [Schistocerca nitens]|uniref:mesoderm posterior protein 2-like n=1 Tax=Schistocerca nitens TaxID=7011 RepID=UPI0021193F5F|nr:mesoderm posterior protein 2-like [Schistocerca nitens]